MMKRIRMAILAGSLIGVVIPGAASADPVGDCPIDTGAAWTLINAAPPLVDVANVGSFADHNGDDHWCVRINGAGKAVWRDNSNPLEEL